MSREGYRRETALLLCLVVAFVMAGNSAARASSSYYASANGMGDCSVSSPCSFADALSAASIPGDEVLLDSSDGPFSLSSQPTIPAGVTVRPAAPFVRPVVIAPVWAKITVRGALVGIEVDSDGPLTRAVDVTGPSAQADRMLVRIFNTGVGTQAVRVSEGGTLSNSVVWQEAPSGIGVSAGYGGGTLLGDTVIAYAEGGKAFVADSAYGSPQTTTILNTILEGATDVTERGSGGIAVRVGHSRVYRLDIDYHPYEDLGGSVNGSVSFVDPFHGDFREAPDALTIDKGAPVDGLPALDFGQNARIINSTGACSGLPDIGASEFTTTVSPPASCAPPAPELPPKTAGRPTVTKKKRCPKRNRSKKRKHRCKKPRR